ncbi:MAG: hypothetical protein HGB02_06735 [Chlorobiaceae bacterium]|nr:hypothetical protein [Chlorobiaceae bacterium]
MVQMNSMPKPAYHALGTLALFSCLAFQVVQGSLKATEPTGKQAPFAAADHAFMALQYEKADSLYDAMRQTAPENADLYWKLSRLNISMAEAISPKETDRRMPLYTKAVDFARKAVSIDSTNAAAHTWLAASLAVKADKSGSKEKLARAKEIKHELDKALALNPHDDVAWSILGSYYRQVSSIGWMNRLLGNTFVGKMPEGNPEVAEKAFKKAISLNPRVIRHYHELALLYIDQHRNEEALQTLQVAVRKPVLMKSDIRRLEDIRELIKKLEEE